MLQELYMKGFKSFASPVTLDLSGSDITAIVGPNGSGKSNIVDAIRWVMGEQSPSALRGSKMADVIFSGSENRSAREKAEVSIKLDNSSGQLPLEEESVVLSRRVDRDGSSNYFMDDDRCRLKDIRDLLDDTGLNQEAYSVVGQNRVEAIINSSPKNLREMFEEAAGISRHRRRKEEAERRLERTRQDLQRVDDIIAEIEGRLDPLEKEAERAREYREVFQRMKDLEGSYLIATHRENEDELEKLRERREKLEERAENEKRILAEKQSGLEKLQDKREELQGKLDDTTGDIFQAKSRLQEIDKNLDILEEREKNAGENIENFQERREEAEENLQELMEEQEMIEKELSRLEKLKEEQRLRQEEILAGRERLLHREISLRARLDSGRSEDREKKKENLNRELARLKERYQSQKKRCQELEEEKDRAGSRMENIRAEAENLLEDLERMEEELGELKRDKKIKEEETNSLSAREESLKEELSDLHNRYSRCRSRWQARRRMQRQAQGYYSGVKAVMNRDDLEGIIGPVARLIDVEERFETAVAALLGSRLQQVVVEDSGSARRAIEFLKQSDSGRATFLPLDMIEGSRISPAGTGLERDNGYLASGCEVVEYEDRLENIIDYLLGRTLIASDMKSAVRLSRRAERSLKIATVEGDLVNPGGSMTGGTRQEKSTVLLRRSRQKKELAEKAAGLREERRRLRDELKSLLKRLRSQRDDLQKKVDEIADLSERMREKKSKLEEKKRELNKLESDKEDLSQRLQEGERERDELTERIDSCRKRLERLDEKSRRQQSRQESLERSLERIRNRKEKLDHLLQDARLNTTRLQEKISSQRGSFDDCRDEITAGRERLEELEQKLDESRSRLEDIDERREKLQGRKKSSQEELEELEEKKKELERNLKACRNRCQSREKEVENHRQEKEAAEKELHSLELRAGRLKSALEKVKSRLQDKYDLTLEEARSRFTASEAAEDPREEIEELENRLQKLGDVNLGAIDEYDRLKSRYDFLQDERDDLTSARDSIQGVIDELEEKMSELFLETFEQVDSEFQSTFTRLFDGGSARLELTEPDNPLETGVDITARPPGKRLKRLSLLSGGEKALTAIALIFAFLEVKPSPLYVLDEIGASLDDANLDMFARFLEQYSRFSKFIIVTHRKRLMAIADTIYGVTMSETGVSRLVSVQYEKEMAR